LAIMGGQCECLAVGGKSSIELTDFCVFFRVLGNVPSVLAFQANNTITYSKKSIASAIVIGMGGMGGIMASTVYRQVDYPGYMCVPV
jgi:hypothetical protein